MFFYKALKTNEIEDLKIKNQTNFENYFFFL